MSVNNSIKCIGIIYYKNDFNNVYKCWWCHDMS